jgi:CubicO group peptidase (beta-lactamase class C family)
MPYRLVTALAIALAAGACSGADRPAAAPAAVTDDWVGLWGAEAQVSEVRAGRVELTATDAGWMMALPPHTVALARDGAWLRGAIGDDELRVRLDGNGAGAAPIEAFWIQRPTILRGQAFAHPLAFRPDGAAFVAEVSPLPDELRFYLMVERAAAGGYRAWVREPLRNVGAFLGTMTATRTGDAVELRKADGSLAARGTLTRDAGAPRLALWLEDASLQLALTRRGRDDAAGFYPRPAAADRYVYAPPADLRDGWRVGAAQDHGLDPEPIRALVQSIVDGVPTGWASPAIHSLVIARYGFLVVDEYFAGYTAETLHDSRSSGKSWVSALAGVAVDRGELALTSPLLATIGRPADADPRKNAITLEHLLTMSTGLDCDDDDSASPGNENRMQGQTGQPDWYRYMLDLAMVRAPGERAVYCSGTINLVGAMLEAAARARGGEPWLPARFAADLARPLQIERFAINLMPSGAQGYLGGGIHLRPRDLAKLPQVFLDAGRWNGAYIVSEAWADASIAPHATIEPDAGVDYGYAWWRTTYHVGGRDYPAFYASGNGGQLAIGIPSLGLVVAFTAGNYQNAKTWRAFVDELVPRYVIAAVR